MKQKLRKKEREREREKEREKERERQWERCSSHASLSIALIQNKNIDWNLKSSKKYNQVNWKGKRKRTCFKLITIN